MAKTIYVLSGPKPDLPGSPESAPHGDVTRADVEKVCAETAEYYGLRADCRHPTCEDELIDFIRHAGASKAVGIVLNAESCGYDSIALRHALTAATIPTVEVQTGGVSARDNIRHHPLAAQRALASLCGFGIDGYRLAITGLAARIGAKAAA